MCRVRLGFDDDTKPGYVAVLCRAAFPNDAIRPVRIQQGLQPATEKDGPVMAEPAQAEIDRRACVTINGNPLHPPEPDSRWSDGGSVEVHL